MKPTKIYIPSFSRVDTVFADNNTVQSLKVLKDRLTLVVYAHEEFDYIESMPEELVGVEVVVCDIPTPSYSQKYKWIGEFAASRGEEKFVIADDDLCFYVRKNTTAWNLRNAEADDVVRMFDLIDLNLDTYSSVGLTGRQGVSHQGAECVEDEVVENIRIVRIVAFRTEAFLACTHDRIPYMCDFDTQLQILRRGEPTAALKFYADGQKSTQAPGGCSVNRNHDNHNYSAITLAELHPEFVRLRQKNNKTGGAFGTRTEVTIQWKKAYQKGLETLL
jgi:hypothetical protein